MSPTSPRDALEVAVGKLSVRLETLTDSVLAINAKLDALGTDVLRCIAQMPHLVTREDCTREMSAASNDLKDRMDGKREVTGVHQTLPELQASKALQQRGGARTLRVVLGIISAVIALLGFGSCVGIQLYRTNQGLERLERIVEQRH